VGAGTDETPEGWDYLSYGEKETTGSDICPECVQSFQDWLKNLEPKTVNVHHYAFEPTVTDAVEREMKKMGVCTCPKYKVNDPTKIGSVIGWTYKPCPLHPITTTY
jgi:hypothetical protein